jgi:hypothetical protein
MLNHHADYVRVKIDTIRIRMVLRHFGTQNENSAETPNKLSMIKDADQASKYFKRPQVTAKRPYRRETVTVKGKPQVRYRDLKTGRFIKKPK